MAGRAGHDAEYQSRTVTPPPVKGVPVVVQHTREEGVRGRRCRRIAHKGQGLGSSPKLGASTTRAPRHHHRGSYGRRWGDTCTCWSA